MTDTGRVVYTALMGGYEELLEQPMARESSVPFVCFTDDATLHSDDWEIRLVRPVLGADRIRSSRALKITGHPSLSAYAESLWIDNRVRLTTDPEEILDTWLDGQDVSVPRHSYRADVVSEFQAVLDAGMDDSSRLYEQLTHYSALSGELLQHPAPWTGILARRRTPAVDEAMEQWLRHVLRYSRRDQLSFVQAMHEAGVSWSSMDIGNLRSDLHEWREPIGRSTRPPAFQVAESLQPPVAALGEVRLAFEQTIAGMAAALESREQAIDAVERRNAELQDLRAQDQAKLDRLRVRIKRIRRERRTAERRLARQLEPVSGPRRLLRRASAPFSRRRS